MCTVTWLRTDDGSSYDLFCNRDERHERAEAEPPAVHEHGGVRFLAPTDPDGGGTWIAANEHGLALCLLNGYAADDDLLPSSAFTSRGLLVRELATSRTSRDVFERLGARELASFRSFRLLLLSAQGPARAAVWNRAAAELTDGQPAIPLISCPVRTDEVRAARRATLEALVAERGVLDTEVLEQFHRSRHPEGWIWSVAMQHDRAATRSLTRVQVTGRDVRMTYSPGRPGDAVAGPTIGLTRSS